MSPPTLMLDLWNITVWISLAILNPWGNHGEPEANMTKDNIEKYFNSWSDILK